MLPLPYSFVPVLVSQCQADVLSETWSQRVSSRLPSCASLVALWPLCQRKHLRLVPSGQREDLTWPGLADDSVDDTGWQCACAGVWMTVDHSVDVGACGCVEGPGQPGRLRAASPLLLAAGRRGFAHPLSCPAQAPWRGALPGGCRSLLALPPGDRLHYLVGARGGHHSDETLKPTAECTSCRVRVALTRVLTARGDWRTLEEGGFGDWVTVAVDAWSAEQGRHWWPSLRCVPAEGNCPRFGDWLQPLDIWTLPAAATKAPAALSSLNLERGLLFPFSPHTRGRQGSDRRGLS